MAGELILVVDDNESNQKLVSFVLGLHGFQVRKAWNAREALEEIAAHPPQLVLMDIQLPGMDGLTLTRRLRSEPQTRGLVIVALSAYAMAGDEKRALDAGCDGYVAKPIDTRTFADQIAGYLPRAR